MAACSCDSCSVTAIMQSTSTAVKNTLTLGQLVHVHVRSSCNLHVHIIIYDTSVDARHLGASLSEQ